MLAVKTIGGVSGQKLVKDLTRRFCSIWASIAYLTYLATLTSCIIQFDHLKSGFSLVSDIYNFY